MVNKEKKDIGFMVNKEKEDMGGQTGRGCVAVPGVSGGLSRDVTGLVEEHGVSMSMRRIAR